LYLTRDALVERTGRRIAGDNRRAVCAALQHGRPRTKIETGHFQRFPVTLEAALLHDLESVLFRN
jgi:hypothetical protein